VSICTYTIAPEIHRYNVADLVGRNDPGCWWGYYVVERCRQGVGGGTNEGRQCRWGHWPALRITILDHVGWQESEHNGEFSIVGATA
jgi:hypothetical protein